MRLNPSLPILVAVFATACGTQAASDSGCTVVQDPEWGTTKIVCDDGTSAVIENGADGTSGNDGAQGQQGAEGDGCTGTSLPDGGFHIDCENGASFDIPATGSCPMYMFPDQGFRNALYVDSPDDLEPLRGCQALVGDLYLMNYDDLTALDSAVVITGNVYLWPDASGATTPVRFAPKLHMIQGEVQIANTGRTAIEMTGLASVGGDLHAEGASGLTVANFPALARVGGDFAWRGASELRVVHAPLLTSVGGVAFEHTPMLAWVDIGEITTAHSVTIEGADALVTVNPLFSALETVDSVSLIDNARLAAWSTPALRSVGNVTLEHNPALARWSYRSDMEITGTLTVHGNTSYAICTAPTDLAAQLVASDNGVSDGTSCDNCPNVANPDQADHDFDGAGDACDEDDDGDSVLDADDGAPTNPWICADADGDGCDDCRVLGAPNVNQDGEDQDADGVCDSRALLPFGGEDCYNVPGTELLRCNADRVWAEASDDCVAHGGQLWEPTSPQGWLVADANYDLQDVWIGIQDLDHEGTFEFLSSGDAALALLWSPGEPNNQGNEDCVQFAGFNGQHALLNDLNCAAARPYVCEPLPW